MWIKNARLYKLTSPITVDMNNALSQFPFVPCGSLDPYRYGFVPPIPGTQQFVHAGDYCGIFCAKLEEKILPGAAVKVAVEKKIQEIQTAENRPVGPKERGTIKDETIFSMLPKAFTREKLEYAYVDLKLGLIVVDSASANRAEELLSKLREALGSLRCLPWSSKNSPTQAMTHWVRNQEAPAGFELGDSVELECPKDGRVVRCKNHDLTAAEVINHIESGMAVTKLQMVWREAIAFSVDSDLAIKAIKFGDAISDKANDGNPETRAEQFDIDFRVMSLELRAMLTDLIAAFGGESAIDNSVS